MKNIRCTTVSSREEIEDLGEIGPDAALEIFDGYPWIKETENFFNSEDAVCAPCIWYVSKEDNGSYLVISGLEDGLFDVKMAVILKPGFLGLFRKGAILDLDDLPLNEARQFLERFYSLDLYFLYHWVKKKRIRSAEQR